MKIPKFHQLFLSVVDVCKFIYQLKLTNEILTRNLEKKITVKSFLVKQWKKQTKIRSFTTNTNMKTFREIIFRLYVAGRYVLFAPNEAVSGWLTKVISLQLNLHCLSLWLAKRISRHFVCQWERKSKQIVRDSRTTIMTRINENFFRVFSKNDIHPGKLYCTFVTREDSKVISFIKRG